MTNSKLLDMEHAKTDLMNRLEALNELQKFWSEKVPASKEEETRHCYVLNQIIQRKGVIMAAMIEGQRNKKISGAGAVAPVPTHSQEIPSFSMSDGLGAPDVLPVPPSLREGPPPAKIFLRQFAGENYNDIPYVLQFGGYYRREQSPAVALGLPPDFDQLLNEDDKKFMAALKFRG